MEADQATGVTTGALVEPGVGLTGVPVPPLARSAIADHQRRIAEANAALQVYLAGLAAGLGIPTDRIEGIDLDTWTIRLRGGRPEPDPGKRPIGPRSA